MKNLFLLAFFALANIAVSAQVSELADATGGSKRILIVVTSNDRIGETGKKTGYHLGEVSHAWEVFTNAGYEVDFVSPLGGKAPADAVDLSDATNARLWSNTVYRKKLEETMRPAQVLPLHYSAIYFAGGHGAMWDLPENRELQDITSLVWKNGGVVGAVCHGPAGLVNVKLEDGAYLLDGRAVNSFTNEEETARGMDKEVPFLLEDKLVERGARFEQSAEFKEHVEIDGRLITGQNPASARGVAQAIVATLGNR
jgi:putative intracellular protease/amidase